MSSFLGLLGRHAPRVVANHARKRGWIDLRLGYELMWDRRVSVLAKLAALATGVTLTAILVAMEAPLELLVGAVLPLLGVAMDLAVDGMEFVVLPLIFASIVIRYMTPKHIVESVRQRMHSSAR